ncbi:MAG: ribonuclease P [Euryarchaeota archaeon]|jgi:RNase P/RNase MRP subunit p29|nr:ribonuclease P [Euryarchaeota archaeon]MEC7703899.1 ribonuclease P protein subunit [Candidatus Thermoplasmatota archaeon]|tara:strand:+ start:104 stop:364 length:261 start_codon:yes stop_codon:yes gene_type:complete
MSDSIHMPFLARTLTVRSSTDSQLVGLSGTVVDETRRTIALDVGGKTKKLAKNVIDFTLDNEGEIIQGAMVCQRPEDRIHRNYRRN